jgi:superfamily II DNA or RNA helicase
MNEQLILTVYPHSKWGTVLLPVLVEERDSGERCLLETAQKSFSKLPNLNEAARELVCITERYADQSLLKSYSKEQTIKDFHATVTENTIEIYIRPFIERCHQKIIRLLNASGIPLYKRKDIKDRTFWPSDRISIPTKASSVVFTFEKDEHGLRYFLRIEGENGLIDLYSQDCSVICREPAIIVTNNSLYSFEDIDVKKLMPFFHKKAIEVPLASEKTYMKTFVRNCIQKYKVNASGLDIQEIQPVKEAFLSLESDLNKQAVLILSLVYEGKKYPLDHTHRKIVLSEETAEQVSLHWFFPDKTWEKQQTDRLTDNGLQQIGPSSFTLPENLNRDPEEGTHGLIDWLRAHEDVTAFYQFSQNFDKRCYYLGEISIVTTMETKQDWFDLHCLVLFDTFQLPFNRFRQHILNNSREYVLPDGTIAILPNEWFTLYYELMFFSKDNQASLLLKKNQYRIAEPLSGGALFPTVQNMGCPLLPSTFRGNLRHYQLTGFQWLVWLYQQGFGGCLADDMGLGKTVQAIALLTYIEETFKQEASTFKTDTKAENQPIPDKHARQLSLFDQPGEPNEPPRVIEEVTRTIHERLPSLIVMPTSLVYNWQHELHKLAPGLSVYTYSGSKRLKSKDIERVFQHYSVILTTYGVLRNDIEWLGNCRFHHLILDESQYVKNPGSQIYQAVRQIQALHTIALTGTPVENSLTDLWAQFNLLNENMLGHYASFRNAYLNPIAKDNKAKELALLRVIHPFLLRRTKQEVTPDLPPLLEETVYCDMSPAQKSSYTEEKNALRNSLLNENTGANPGQRSLLTLQGLTRLRLLANHPVLVHPDYTEDSGKFEQILMRLDTLRAEGHKVLIFSSFVRHLKLLANYMDEENQPYAWLSGSTPATEREKEINRFTNNAAIHCFLISLKAGGVGLNLTAADYVFLLDPWWNPASEMQALSRSHRIGQDRQVIVYRFISSKTIEEKIRRLQESKSKLANTFVRSGNPLADISREDLEQLIG